MVDKDFVLLGVVAGGMGKKADDFVVFFWNKVLNGNIAGWT